MMQVPPALAPHGGALLPAQAVAGEQDLQGLGEARLAGAVAPDDERQAGARPQLQGPRGADPAETLDGDRAQEGAGGGRRCARRGRACDGGVPRQLRLELVRALEGREDEGAPGASTEPSASSRDRTMFRMPGLPWSSSARLEDHGRQIVAASRGTRPLVDRSEQPLEDSCGAPAGQSAQSLAYPFVAEFAFVRRIGFGYAVRYHGQHVSRLEPYLTGLVGYCVKDSQDEPAGQQPADSPVRATR